MSNGSTTKLITICMGPLLPAWEDPALFPELDFACSLLTLSSLLTVWVGRFGCSSFFCRALHSITLALNSLSLDWMSPFSCLISLSRPLTFLVVAAKLFLSFLLSVSFDFVITATLC